MLSTGISAHFFGPRYTLPISLALYLYAAAGIVIIAFVLVAIFAGDQVGARALQYPLRRVQFLVPLARSPVPRLVGGTVGILALFVVLITGLFGSTDPTRNPAQYLTWIYFWVATVIASGLLGNLWLLLNPWAALYDVVSRFTRLKPMGKLPERWRVAGIGGLFLVCLSRTDFGDGEPASVGGCGGARLHGADDLRDDRLWT